MKSFSAESFSLKGQNIIVTGATGGLGQSISLGLARAGANLILVARDEKKMSGLAKKASAFQARVWPFSFDLSNFGQIPQLFSQIAATAGEIHGLFNVAGINLRHSAVDFPQADWDNIITINLTVPFICAQNFARHCIAAKRGGKIVNVTSLMSEAARPTVSAYVAAKGGLKHLTGALAVEWAPYQINVNAIGPGYFRTELTEPLAQQPEFNKWVLESTPMKRWGVPDDLAGAAVFLASPASDFITGQTIYVDGGWLSSL